MSNIEFEINVRLILEIFPTYKRNFIEKWLNLYDGDVGRVCDYLAQSPVVVPNVEVDTASGGCSDRYPSGRIRTFDKNDVSSTPRTHMQRDECECTAKVIFAYTAQNTDELTICAGDIVTDVKKIHNGWFKGKVNGKYGVFPGSFVELSTTVKPMKKCGFKARVTLDSEAEVEGELALKVGDVIDVIDTSVSPGWWRGSFNGNVGIFPSSFVEVEDENHSVKSKRDESQLTNKDAKKSTVPLIGPLSNVAKIDESQVNTSNIKGPLIGPHPNIAKIDESPVHTSNIKGPSIGPHPNIAKIDEGPVHTSNIKGPLIGLLSNIAKIDESPVHTSNIKGPMYTEVKPRSNQDVHHTSIPRHRDTDYVEVDEKPSEINKDQMPQDSLSQTQEENLVNFFENKARWEGKKSEQKNEGTSASSGKSGASREKDIGCKRLKICGRIRKVIADKRFGFITQVQDKPAKDTEMSKDDDVFFHFDKVRSYLFELKVGDIVQYSLYQDKKKKTSAVNIILLKPTKRSYKNISDYLGLLDEEITSSIEEKKPNCNLAQMLGSPIIWNHLSEMISGFSSKDDNVMIFKLLDIICKLERMVKSLDESFKQMLSALTNPSFFNPFRGRLKDVIKQTKDKNQLDKLQNFLLLVVKYVPDKTQAVVALTKPIVEKALPGSTNFLFEMLRSVSKLSSGNIDDIEWDNMPLIMTNEEVHSPLISDHMNLRPVICKGQYSSPNEYIETYFRLLRVDCFSSLKKGIQDYLNGTLDKRDMNIYINVVLYGIDLGKDCLYLALKVTPTQKVKDWETSSNLMFGNLLCLSVGGNFKNLIWATVADRDLLKTDNIVMVQSCNEFNTSNDGEMIIDMISTGLPIVMAEAPTYYRAYQPVLKALQAIHPEDISFRDEIVYLQEGPDKFFSMEDLFDATLVYKKYKANNGMITLRDFILNDYNKDNSIFDESQEFAVKSAFCSNIGIIQGPPGSGKSFIGVQMLRIILSMTVSESKKVVILTYKNHALDEFVKSVLQYFPSLVVRIGGKSRDQDIEKVSLRSIRREGKRNYDFIDQKNSISDEVEQLKEDIEKDFEELNKTANISYAKILSQLSPEQQLSIIKECDWRKSNFPSFGETDDEGFQTKQRRKGRKKTITSREVVNILKDTSNNGDKIMKLAYAAFKIWVPEKNWFSKAETMLTGIADIQVKQRTQNFKESNKGDKKDDNNVDKEEIKAIEEERLSALPRFNTVNLKGKAERRIKKIDIPNENDAIRTFSIAASKKLLTGGYDMLTNYENVWDMEPLQRVYLIEYIASKERENICLQFEENVKLYEQKRNQLSEIDNQITSKMLEDKQIVAMTITGASIHNMLLKEMQPDIVIIEEAAEILEPQLVAAIGSWSKYMLLIGDHFQLRPSVETYELKKDFHFDLSMMERLINNNMRFATLEMQNRQRPEFAELLLDIYPDLKTNFERVKNNLPATCLMKSMFFWNHNFAENKERSVTNQKEGERAVMLALFLIQQGYKPNQITILATYQGQTSLIRKCLQEKMEKYKKFLGTQVNTKADKDKDDMNKVIVHTVDMYQGDENDFVIISLVRSNDEKYIGFLKERNRRCVAQSRAKCGVYFIGNASMFFNHPTWHPMMKLLHEEGRIGDQLEIRCKNHPHVSLPVEDLTLQCFCQQPCAFEMVCAIHKCERYCQPPHPHSPCEKTVPFTHVICGHRDKRKCKEKEDDKKCKSEVTFTFPNCLHEGRKKCYEDSSAIICKFQASVKLPLCGHLMKKLCFQNVNDLKCEEICARVMKTCGHPCNHKCYEHELVKGCEVCDRLRKIEAERQRKAEDDLRRQSHEAIEAEIKEIRKRTVTKFEVFREELKADGCTSAEYLDIEDHVKKYIQPTHAWFPKVTKIEKVTNYFLKLKWLTAKRELFDPEGRSALKFHGTSDAGITGITKEGFRLPTAGNPMYGFGVYFASDSSKSAQEMYTKGSNKLLLCDVLLGKPFTVEQACRDMTAVKLKQKKYDSLFAKRDTRAKGGVLYDEFVIFDPFQAYPKYVIHYDEGRCIDNPATQLQFTNTFTTGSKKILPTRGLKANDPLDMHFRIAESQFLRLLNKLGKQNDLAVKEVEVYMNPNLKQKFEQKLNEFEKRYGAGKQESEFLLLFHGTKGRDIVENIMDNNFNKSIRGKFGPGVYFSEFPSYTFGYGGVNHLILSKVLPGKIYPARGNQSLQPGFDSHGGIPRPDAGGYSEIVIFNTDQILPCYVIQFN